MDPIASRLTFWRRSLVIGFGCSLISSGSMLAQWYLKGYYKKLLAMYEDGKMVPLPESVDTLISEVAYDMYLDPQVEVDIDFFSAHGQEIMSKGSTSVRNGAIIGIPGTFRYTDKSQVEREKLQLSGRFVDWDSEAGQQLIDSIVLSDNAKRFALAREIETVGNYHIQIVGTLRGLAAVLAYTTGFVCKNAFQMKQRMKPWARGAAYALITGFYGLMYIFVKDGYEVRRDKRNDKRVATLGYSYAQGGLEFYNKMLERNKAIRALMGVEGEKLYTAYGNYMVTWRQPHQQVTARRDYFAKMVEGYDKGEVTPRPRGKRTTFGPGRLKSQS